MKEELRNLIDQELQELDSEDTNEGISIEELVKNQNQKREYLSILEDLKDKGYSVLYDEDMSLEELKELVNKNIKEKEF